MQFLHVSHWNDRYCYTKSLREIGAAGMQHPCMLLVSAQSQHAFHRCTALDDNTTALPNREPADLNIKAQRFFKCIQHVLFPSVALTLQ